MTGSLERLTSVRLNTEREESERLTAERVPRCAGTNDPSSAKVLHADVVATMYVAQIRWLKVVAKTDHGRKIE